MVWCQLSLVGRCRGVNLHSCVPGSAFSVFQSHILKGMWKSIVVALLNEG